MLGGCVTGFLFIQRIAYEFAVDNFEEGVHYVEPRFAPQVRRWGGREGEA